MLTTACLCLLLGQFSYHFNRDYDYNESHNLIGIEYNRYFIAHFENSYGHDSVVVGYRFVRPYRSIELGLKLGAVHGYKDRFSWWNNEEVAPFILLDATISLSKRVAVEFNIAPASGGFASAGLKIAI